MKKVPAFLLFLACALFAFAADYPYTVEVRTDRMDAQYLPGEKAVFHFSVKEGGKPVENATVAWRISKDGAEPFIDSGSMTLEKGTGTLSGTLDEPGFLQCRIDFKTPDGKAIGYRAGAAYNPLDIKPSLPAPADFDAFWAAQKKLLKDAPVTVNATEIPSGDPAVRSYDMQIDCAGGHIRAFLSVPADTKPGTCPAIITLHGAGVRGSSLGATRTWAKLGFVALDYNVHGLPADKPLSFYDALSKNELKDYPNKGRDSRDTHFFRGLYTRLMCALEVLTARPEWDQKILVAQGGSQGGAQAFAAAGLDGRVTFFCAAIPAMCDITGVSAARTNGWPTNRYGYPTPQSKPTDMTPAEIAAAQYFDCVNFAARAKGEAFVTVGYADNVCPPTTVYAAYNNIPTQKRMLVMPLVEHRGATPEALATAKQAILEHARQMRAR